VKCGQSAGQETEFPLPVFILSLTQVQILRNKNHMWELKLMSLFNTVHISIA
jgi:hypothetical protein